MAKKSQPSSGSFSGEYNNEWAHGLLSCCDDFKETLCVAICMPCKLCELSEKAGVIQTINCI